MRGHLTTEKGEIFMKFAREIRDLVWSFHEYRGGTETEEELLELYLGLLEAMDDRVLQQRRTIHFLQGKPVKPMVHEARAIVTGRGGFVK